MSVPWGGLYPSPEVAINKQTSERLVGAVVHVGDFMEISGLDGEDSWLNGRAGIVSSEESPAVGGVDRALLVFWGGLRHAQ